MTNKAFTNRITKYVDAEIDQASSFLKVNDLVSAFHHLERAHVLGQAVTIEHTLSALADAENRIEEERFS